MNLKKRLGIFVIPIFLMGGIPLGQTLAKEISFGAKVFPINGEPVTIKGFTINSKQRLYAEWREGFVTLRFQDIKSIRFLEPGSSDYLAEIVFRDQRKDKFKLMPALMSGESTYGKWCIHPVKTAKIEFLRLNKDKRGRKAEYSKFDQIRLKNGDTVSGEVQTKIFKILTPYGEMDFETPQIGYIDFEGGTENNAIVGLRIGDRLSGVIQAQTVRLLMRAGKAVDLDKEKIKKITFVLVKK